MSADSAMERRTETIPEWKREEIDELVEFLESYDSVGIVGVGGIPSRQLQSMRAGLHGDATVLMGRNTLMRRALEQVDAGFEALTEFVTGEVAFIGTDANPFTLYQQLESSKTPAPIAAGEVAPTDIVIDEGDTGVDPGPFVGELQNVGASARIMEGSIQVTEDSVVCEGGETVDADLENVLGELGIEPKEVGLDLRAVHSEGVLFEPAELDVDIDAYRDDVATAAARARNVAVESGFPTGGTLPATLARAAGRAKALAVHAAIEDPDVLPELVAQADAQLRALATHIDDEEALPEELHDTEGAATDDADGDGDSRADDADGDGDSRADDADGDGDTVDEGGGDDDDGDVGAGLDSMF